MIQCGNRSRLYPLASLVRTGSAASMLVAEAALGTLGGARLCGGVGAALVSRARARVRVKMGKRMDFMAAVVCWC